MIEGLLQINLDPPYIAFDSQDNGCSARSCTTEDIRALLIALNALGPGRHWPLCDFTMRLAGQFDSKTLQQFGLLKPTVVEPQFKPTNQLLRLQAS